MATVEKFDDMCANMDAMMDVYEETEFVSCVKDFLNMNKKIREAEKDKKDLSRKLKLSKKKEENWKLKIECVSRRLKAEKKIVDETEARVRHLKIVISKVKEILIANEDFTNKTQEKLKYLSSSEIPSESTLA